MFEDRKLNSFFSPDKLELVRTHPFFKKSIESLRKTAEELLATDPPRLKYSEMHIYYTEGTREPYDSKYWAYENRLVCFFNMYMLFGGDEYLKAITDMLYDICNMEMWSSAHGIEESRSLKDRRTMLDLRSTGMGRSVAMVLYYLGDKLPELVYRRAKSELRERIIDAYATSYNHWWMRTTLNWAAVCTGNIMMTYIYMAEKNEIAEQLPRMLHSLELYISGFDDEGCCPEGYGYWNYGMVHYCPAAILLRDYTEGKIDLFRNSKVHNIALFQQNAAMNDREDVPFSDTTKKFSPIPWLSHFLKSEYEDVEIPSLKAPDNFSTQQLYTLTLLNPEYEGSVMKGKSFYYSGAQWFIHRADRYSFVCKAGYNNEPHNHNDVGSFAISKNGSITLDDPGRARYDKDYWDYGDKRYSQYVCCSSRGHSVPIIDGCYQVTGKEKSRVLIATENEFSFDMEQAYSYEALKRLNRHIICKPEGVSLTDSFQFSGKPEALTERFVTLIEPKITPDGVQVGDSIIRYDSSQVEAPTVSFEDFFVDAGTRRVYQIDFKVKNITESLSCSFLFE